MVGIIYLRVIGSIDIPLRRNIDRLKIADCLIQRFPDNILIYKNTLLPRDLDKLGDPVRYKMQFRGLPFDQCILKKLPRNHGFIVIIQNVVNPFYGRVIVLFLVKSIYYVSMFIRIPDNVVNGPPRVREGDPMIGPARESLIDQRGIVPPIIRVIG
jgi:hypothetical protein